MEGNKLNDLGYIGTNFAYGQTGAGKTFTMMALIHKVETTSTNEGWFQELLSTYFNALKNKLVTWVSITSSNVHSWKFTISKSLISCLALPIAP